MTRRKGAITYRWISIDDDWPDDRQRVLTWNPERYMSSESDWRLGLHTFYKNYADLEGWWFMGDQNYMAGDGHITHWAPTPDGPEDV